MTISTAAQHWTDPLAQGGMLAASLGLLLVWLSKSLEECHTACEEDTNLAWPVCAVCRHQLAISTAIISALELEQPVPHGIHEGIVACPGCRMGL